MVTNLEAFEKWFDTQLDNENAFTSDEHICKQAWQAAQQQSTHIDAVKFQELLDAMCADKDKEIAELKAAQQQGADDIAELEKEATDWKLKALDNALAYAKLKADNERLREALLTTQDALSQLIHHGIEQWAKDRANDAYKYIEKALCATPSQSLQAHDEELIERCADVCYSSYRKTNNLHDLSLADSIMELKGKQ